MFGLLKNLYKWVNKKQERVLTIVLLGVDHAGKSSVLYSLKGEQPDFIAPTVGFSSEVIVVGKYQMKIYDLGGGPTFRGIWGRYYSEVHAAVFVVDSTDERKMQAAKDALHGALQHPRFQKKPVLVLANKQDLNGAMTTDQVASTLELDKFRDYEFHVIGCTAQLSSMGGVIDPNIKRGLEWLTKTVDSRFKELQAQVNVQMAEQKEEEKREREAKRLRVEAMRREREREKELEREKEKEKEKEFENQPKITVFEGSEKKNEIEIPQIVSQLPQTEQTEIKITGDIVSEEKTGWVSLNEDQSKKEATDNTTISLTPRNSGSSTFRNAQQQNARANALKLEPIVIPLSPAFEPSPSLSSLVSSTSKTDSENNHTIGIGKRESFYETTPSKILPNIPLNVSNNASTPS